jgi:ATPase subunit of ABC transporter with duplicated ATPase domains
MSFFRYMIKRAARKLTFPSLPPSFPPSLPPSLRYFVSQVANRIVAVEDKKLVVYEGDYHYYMQKNEEMKSKIEGRYVDGVSGIRQAPKVEEGREGGKVGKEGGKKNFGGKAPGISGRKEKGVKNAKRMTL